METVCRVAELRRRLAPERRSGRRVALVPTMGALHPGHLSLLARARAAAEVAVMSIFVNPAQFAPGEDFAAYPRDPARDAALAADAGVDVLFLPDDAEVYPPGFRSFVTVPGLEDRLCGRSRPGHFRGVATVVAKLLNMVQPDLLLLGQKDAQQLVLLRRMVRDLDLDVEVIGCPTVREPDGLAMSSRNVYLSPAERTAAGRLHRALERAADRFAAGERDGAALASVLRGELLAEPLVRVDYAEVVDPETLEPLRAIGARALAVIAAFVGKTRLIDNEIFGAAAPPPR